MVMEIECLPRSWPRSMHNCPNQVITQLGYHHHPGVVLTEEMPKYNREIQGEYFIEIKGNYYKSRILEILLHAFWLCNSFLISLIRVCVCSSVSMGSSYWQNKPGVNYGRIEIDSALKHWSAQFTSGRASVFTETWLSSAPRVIRCVIQ